MAFPALPGLSRGPQGEEAAEETGSPTLALPGSRPSPSFPLQLFSRGPQSRRSKTASSTGDTGPSVRQLVWFGFSDGHGARYRRGIPVGAGGGAVNACAAQPRADTCPVAGAAKSGLGDIFSWRNVVSSRIRRNAPQSTGVGRRGGAGDVPPRDRHQPVPCPALPLWGASRRRAPPKQTRTPAWTQMSS